VNGCSHCNCNCDSCLRRLQLQQSFAVIARRRAVLQVVAPTVATRNNSPAESLLYARIPHATRVRWFHTFQNDVSFPFQSGFSVTARKPPAEFANKVVSGIVTFAREAGGEIGRQQSQRFFSNLMATRDILQRCMQMLLNSCGWAASAIHTQRHQPAEQRQSVAHVIESCPGCCQIKNSRRRRCFCAHELQRNRDEKSEGQEALQRDEQHGGQPPAASRAGGVEGKV
jgi:hypothetical protein